MGLDRLIVVAEVVFHEQIDGHPHLVAAGEGRIGTHRVQRAPARHPEGEPFRGGAELGLRLPEEGALEGDLQRLDVGIAEHADTGHARRPGGLVIDVQESIAIREAPDESVLRVQHRSAVHVHPERLVAYTRPVRPGREQRGGRDPEGRLDRRETDGDGDKGQHHAEEKGTQPGGTQRVIRGDSRRRHVPMIA